MPTVRFALAAVLPLLLVASACDASRQDPSGASLPGLQLDAAPGTALRNVDGLQEADAPLGGRLYATARRGHDVDLRFWPVVHDGDTLEATSGAVRLSSQRQGHAHHVAACAPAGARARVEGVLDGVVQAAVDADPSGAAIPGGTTSETPTSVHRYVECVQGVCTTRIEYDYDLTEPSGNGRAWWYTPDGRTHAIDRIRAVAETPAADATPLTLSGFRRIVFAR